ncbi:serine-rich adhesin for platelets isoform X3 [Drosophila pseudoobscura]|uniref:Serine-rich adhesin for platelets isoform X3 n=1 Tax=Drosophila pseudoobscura pseudoobscura TaxID=46245 RepID=A0A6I8VZE1_DROPS|nr:serine-rich adhesin for platelets isoform X3 [Drosophila pseudoobscura]
MHFVTQQRQQQQQHHQQQQQQQRSTSSSNSSIASTSSAPSVSASTRFVALCKSSSQGALPKTLATAQSLFRQSSHHHNNNNHHHHHQRHSSYHSQQHQQQHNQQRHKRTVSLNSTPMIKDFDTITNPTTTNARTADSPCSSKPPANANANMLAETQHESQPESQSQSQSQIQTPPLAKQTPERCQEEPTPQQQEQPQEEEYPDPDQRIGEDRPEERAAPASCSNGGDRRDSITEEIVITTTTTNSKLLTIQEAAGILEHSSISISASSKQNSSTTTTSTAAAVSTAGTVAAATVATAVAAAAAASGSQQRNEPSVASSSSNGINSGSNPSLAQATSSSNTNLAHSSSGSNVPQTSTPTINIVGSDQARDQPLQSQSVDSNGHAQAGGSCGDSPSSRKSSTSSKGRASQPKLSTSSSGRDEDTAQNKLSNELTLHELSILRVDRATADPQVSSSSNSNEKSAKPSRLSERAKKKSWYNVIYPNYKSRAGDFKKLFKDVPNDERLIVDYSCALQRDILVQGRLYVSQNYVCFHANIFSWETYVSIKWKDVTAITKEKTALVIPNAISIATSKDKYFFATFTSRDKSFLMLFRVWQNTLMNKQFSPQEIWKYVHNCYGEELGLTTDDEDYIDPTLHKDTETDVEFQTAIDDDQSNQSQQQLQQPQQRLSGNSSASSGGSGRAAEPRKSKTKYFFNSSKSSNSANASASGSDNNKDSNRKLSKKMKQNAKELTLSSVKPAEQSVGVTMMNLPGSAGSSNRNSTESSAATAAAASTNNTNNSSISLTTTASGSDKKSAEKKISTSSNSGAAAAAAAAAATAAAASLSAAAEAKQVATLESKRKMSKNHRQREAELVGKNAEEQAPTDVSDSSDSEENNVPFVATTECTSTHEGRQIVHTILPISVDTLFNLLFTKSKFVTDFHAMRKSTDLVMGEWTKNEEGLSVRVVNVTVQLAASVGPKTSKVTEYQTMRPCSKPGELYSIDINSVNAGIPYADSFSVLIHFCLARTVDDHTMLSIHTQIKYKKSIWGVVKGFIEKNTWAGVEDFFGAQLHALQSETCIPPAKGKGRRPRRGINQQSTTTKTATAGTTAVATDSTAVTETGTATSTDNDSIREPSRHHYHHHHQSEQHEHHQHQHLHMHHHHHHHHSTSSSQQPPHQHQHPHNQRQPHHHQHLHHHHQHSQQPLWHHRKAIFQSSKGTATQIRSLEEAAGGGSGTAQTGISDTLLESHLLSGGGVAGSGSVGAASGHALLHEHGKLQQLSGLQQQHHHQQQHLQKHLGGVDLGGVGSLPLALGQGQGHRFLKHKGLSLFVILLLCLMLALNVILLLKLWKLEERIDVDLSRRARFPSLAALKELPNTNEEWLELLRQQEQSHEGELRKWQQVLQTAIELLKKTEKTLAEVIVR